MRTFTFEYEKIDDESGLVEKRVEVTDAETVTLPDVLERFTLFLQAVGYPVVSLDVALDAEVLDADFADNSTEADDEAE